MSVPLQIRQVPRPVNSVVIDNGGKGSKRYIVRSRKGYKTGPTGKRYSVNGKVIGYIYDGQYISRQASKLNFKKEAPWLEYAASRLIYMLSRDIVQDLTECFDLHAVESIMAIASLRILVKNISAYSYSEHFDEHFISMQYPGASVSKNSVTQLLENIGKSEANRINFFTKRLSYVQPKHLLAIDGTLKQDNSSVNLLSEYSHKAKIKEFKDISILYAYDTTQGEPVCSQVFPGSTLDMVAVRTFVTDHKISKGIILTDKGFRSKDIRKFTEEYKNLGMVIPLRNNDTRINTYNMLTFNKAFTYQDDKIFCSKNKTTEGDYLYAFKNLKMSYRQQSSVHEGCESSETAEGFYEKYKKINFCGVIVFESTLDVEPEEVYKIYKKRWLLELVFDRYKHDLELTESKCEKTFSIIGSEFINFISTLITCRILNKAEDAGILNEMSYGELMHKLSMCSRRTQMDKNEGNIHDTAPDINDNQWINLKAKTKNILIRLGIATGEELKIPKKREKPRNQEMKKEDQIKKTPGRPRIRPVIMGPKRPVGRPRKNKTEEPVSKRPRGRPRKSVSIEASGGDGA